CGNPIAGFGIDNSSASPPDGRNCPACRSDLETSGPPESLFKALFGRQNKDTSPRPPAGP
ncbi:hypothetical protein, partial [Streptomyces fagopyri]|uniref:hypothetical protein n=1 Tax=Streptomyces fagopyri TaxID=2662397 RepID=UPI0033C1FB1B